MTAQRISTALDRIDRALARIETQAALAPHSGPATSGNARLVEKHEALRDSVAATIAELDTLIAGMEG